MRARLAIASAGIQVELREILLRDKAPDFLAISPSATVPCLVSDREIIDQSRDIMTWALTKSDPAGWLDMPDEGQRIVDAVEGPFKTALDRYKYSTRYENANKTIERDNASSILLDLNRQLEGQAFLFGGRPTFADMATLPFIRQFAMVDKVWFDAQNWPHLSRWVEAFLTSDRFRAIMTKYPVWKSGDQVTIFA